jgi:hypothetical protein
MSNKFEGYLEANSYSQRALSSDEVRSKSYASDGYDARLGLLKLQTAIDDIREDRVDSVTEKMWTKVLIFNF